MHKTISIGLTMRSLPQNLWKNVGIPKMKIVPSLWAYLVINRIPAPIPGSLVSRLEAGLLTEVFSCRLPERQGFQWRHGKRCNQHSSGNCPGFTPDSLLSPKGTPQIGCKSSEYFCILAKHPEIMFWYLQLPFWKNALPLQPIQLMEFRLNKII